MEARVKEEMKKKNGDRMKKTKNRAEIGWKERIRD